MDDNSEKYPGIIYSGYMTVHHGLRTIQNSGGERACIRGVLQKCNYPNSTNNKDFTTSKVRVAIPYSADLSKKIKNIYKSFGIATLYKPVTQIRYKLLLVKDNTSSDKQYNLVYGFKCSDAGCDESYMGETKQPVKIFTHSKHSGPQIQQLGPNIEATSPSSVTWEDYWSTIICTVWWILRLLELS